MPIRSDEEQHLLDLLQIVTDWLKFVETKNGAGIALYGVTTAAFLQGFPPSSWDKDIATVLMLVALCAWVWSGARCLWAMNPLEEASKTLEVPSRYAILPETAADNPYFYRAYAGKTSADLLDFLGMQPSEGTRAVFEKHLANQIVVNSRITCDKQWAFKRSITSWSIGVVVALAAIGVRVFS